MNEALPSLTALKVFASCARNCSFTRAADELGITPGAVTQHIRSLEQWAGAPLFRRTGRSVLLTDRSEAALPFLTDGFGQISEGIDMLRLEDEQAHVVTVVSPPSLLPNGCWAGSTRFAPTTRLSTSGSRSTPMVPTSALPTSISATASIRATALPSP